VFPRERDQQPPHPDAEEYEPDRFPQHCRRVVADRRENPETGSGPLPAVNSRRGQHHENSQYHNSGEKVAVADVQVK
jgi:hypothetical protein